MSETEETPNTEPSAPPIAQLVTPSEPPKPTVEQINMQSLQDRIALYVEEMKPGKPVSVEHGVQQQMALWQIIRFVLARKGSEFVSLYAELLRLILAERRGVFHEKYIFRFHDALRLSQQDRRNYTRLLNLLLATCDPRTRQLALRQVSLQSAVAGIADNEVVQRIDGFYRL